MEQLIQKLKEATEVTNVTSFTNKNSAVRVLSNTLGIDIPTLRSWFTGRITPHKRLLPVIFEVLDSMIELHEIMEIAPEDF